MPHVQRRNGRYQARYREPSGTERTKTFDRKVDADQYLAQIETSKIRGDWTDPRAGRRKFGEIAREVLDARVDRRATTRARDESVMRSLVSPTFGDRALNAVTPTDVEAWVSPAC